MVFFFNFLFNLYLFLREKETEREQGRNRERRRHRIRSRLQVLSCQHRARHGARTHELRDHDLSRSRTLNRLSHPGALTIFFFFLISHDSVCWLSSSFTGLLWVQLRKTWHGYASLHGVLHCGLLDSTDHHLNCCCFFVACLPLWREMSRRLGMLSGYLLGPAP